MTRIAAPKTHVPPARVLLSALAMAFLSCATYEGTPADVQGSSAGDAGAPAGGSVGSAGEASGGTASAGAPNPQGGAGSGAAGAPGAAGSAMAGTANNGGSASGGMGGTGNGGSVASGGAGRGGTGSAGAGSGGTGSNAGAGAGGKGNAGTGGGGAGAGAGGSGPIVETLLSKSKPAKADSEQTSQSHFAADGNDGVDTTRWCAADGGTGHNWQVDLGALYTLSKLQITWEKAALYLFKVEGSPNGTTWSPVLDQTSSTSSTTSQSYPLAAAPQARWVKVTVTGLPAGVWASFFEFGVYGH